jgi:hypothetical protein
MSLVKEGRTGVRNPTRLPQESYSDAGSTNLIAGPAEGSNVSCAKQGYARKNRRCFGVLNDVRVEPYGDERLARLLRLLRPVPQGWATKAQQTLLNMITEDQREAAESRLTDGDLAQLGRELEIDATFRQRFDLDPVAAVEAAGMHKLALALEREMRELVALAERIANDVGYRADLQVDPIAALVAAGVPATTAEPLLEALGMPDDVLAKLPDVVAHQHEETPLKTRLLLLLLGSSAFAKTLRSATHDG